MRQWQIQCQIGLRTPAAPFASRRLRIFPADLKSYPKRLSLPLTKSGGRGCGSRPLQSAVRADIPALVSGDRVVVTGIRPNVANGSKIAAKLQNRLCSVTPNVISVLGGQQVFGARAGRVDLLEEVERGLPVRAYEAVAEALELTPVEEDRLLQVSLRTRARWKKRARLDAATSDRLVRLARILALAVLVLESREHAVAWLREPSPALGGRSPLAAVASDPGAEKVSNMLYQMEHGVYA